MMDLVLVAEVYFLGCYNNVTFEIYNNNDTPGVMHNIIVLVINKIKYEIRIAYFYFFLHTFPVHKQYV